MKTARWVALSLMIISMAGVTGCVSPFYGTAKIEKGWHADVGVAINTHLMPSIDSWMYYPSYGVRGDIEVRYGINKYLGLHGRGSFGLMWMFPQLFLDGAFGFQAALPMHSITPALRTEISYYGGGLTISPALLLGIGKDEKVTLGGRIHFYGNSYDRKNPHPEYGIRIEDTPIDLFVGIHVKRYTFFAGAQAFFTSTPYREFWPIATLGVGYKLK